MEVDVTTLPARMRGLPDSVRRLLRRGAEHLADGNPASWKLRCRPETKSFLFETDRPLLPQLRQLSMVFEADHQASVLTAETIEGYIRRGGAWVLAGGRYELSVSPSTLVEPELADLVHVASGELEVAEADVVSLRVFRPREAGAFVCGQALLPRVRLLTPATFGRGRPFLTQMQR